MMLIAADAVLNAHLLKSANFLQTYYDFQQKLEGLRKQPKNIVYNKLFFVKTRYFF
jgi:hypothetical protein